MSVAGLQVGAVHTATMFLGQPEGADPGGRGEGFGKSSPVGLLLLVIFLIAVAFLVRSMTKHLKRIPSSFDPEDEQDQQGEQDQQDEASGEPGEGLEHAAAEVEPDDESTDRPEREKTQPG